MLKFYLIYTHLGHVYTVVPNIPWPSVVNAPRASHFADGIVGIISHPKIQPFVPSLMSYGQP